MEKFAQAVLYVSSIVIAIGIGMSQVGVGYISEGSEPCVHRHNRDGGTCPKETNVTGSCTATHYTIAESPAAKNATIDTNNQVDYCWYNTNVACQMYHLHKANYGCDRE